MAISAFLLVIIFKIVDVGISKKASKKKKRDVDSSKSKKTLERQVEADQDDVYLISSGDEDCARGMKSMNYSFQNICWCLQLFIV